MTIESAVFIPVLLIKPIYEKCFLTYVPVKPLKRQTKIAADDILIFHFYLSKKIRLGFSCESSAKQRIHMKSQVLFSLKKSEKYL